MEIGQQVLRKACLECRRWPGGTSVAVNLSPIQFSRSNVPALIRQTLAATGLPAERLHIEITELTLLQDTRKSRAALRQLEKMGVRVSLDDFGTGYSSLSYLQSFPLHKVKIDQSFVEDLDEHSARMTLLRGVARLSAELWLACERSRASRPTSSCPARGRGRVSTRCRAICSGGRFRPRTPRLLGGSHEPRRRGREGAGAYCGNATLRQQSPGLHASYFLLGLIRNRYGTIFDRACCDAIARRIVKRPLFFGREVPTTAITSRNTLPASVSQRPTGGTHLGDTLWNRDADRN